MENQLEQSGPSKGKKEEDAGRIEDQRAIRTNGSRRVPQADDPAMGKKHYVHQ
jgi:hypothetical protein